MSIKFYDNTTEFLEDEIIEETNVLFENDEKSKKDTIDEKDVLTERTTEENELTEEVKEVIDDETNVITDDLQIKEEEIEFIDDEPKFNREITITRSLENKFIQYTDDQFKNNVLLLCKNLCTIDNKISSINNLLKIYKKINNKKVLKLNDTNLVPIIEVKKKFFIYEEKLSNEVVEDALTINNSEFILQDYLENYFTKKQNILKSSTTKNDLKENKLYELERPFDYLDESESKRVKYSPEYDRDSITSCIFQNLDDYNQDDFKCVNILNQPINLEKFRLLTSKTLKLTNQYKPFSDDDNLVLYSGDNVRLVGYITKTPTDSQQDVKIFNLKEYYNDLNDMKENDQVNIYLNFKTNVKDNKYSGSITSIDGNIIKIKLGKEINFLNQKTDVLTYDKLNNYNYFYLYPTNEDKNIYYKNPLREDIVAFVFPEEDKDVKRNIEFILPNITELISYYDDFLNYKDLNDILNQHNFNVDDLDNNDIQEIITKMNKNITKFEKENKNTPSKGDKKYNFNTDNELYKFKEIPKFYTEYLEKNKSIDSNTNRLLYLQKQKDNGFYHFIEILKGVINEEYLLLKDVNYEKDLQSSRKEYAKLEKDLKDKNNDCEEIKISKFYYSEDSLKQDEGNKKELEGKYVLLTDDKNIYSTLYLMKSGNFVEQFKLSADEKNSIRICDGSYYFEKIKDNSCMYDEIEDICNKRNNVVNRRKLDILETQIEVTEGIKDFIENYDKYNKELLDLQNYYSNFNNNELTINQLEYNKVNKNKKYVGDENYINFDDVYNNFETSNDPFTIPLAEEDVTQETQKKDEEYNKIITKILNIVGFELSNEEINHIIKSIDFFIQILREQTINDYKKKNKDSKLSNKEIINKIYQNEIDLQESINRDLILIVLSMIIIIIQIQYPNIKLVKINQKSSKYFSLRGFPIEKVKEENKNKQLYVYVGNCILSNKELKDTINLSSKIFFNKIQITIKIILKKRNYYKTLLDKNINAFDTEDKPLKIKVWSGYKPEISINKEPKTLIGKYIYELYENINDDKIYKFNAFKKPLIENICCYSEITPELNYYDFFRGKINIKKYLNSINSDKDSSDTIKTIENFFNYYKKDGIKSNFDDIGIFDEIIDFKNISTRLDKIPKFSLEYYEYAEEFKNIISSHNKLKSDKFIVDILNNFGKDKKWEELSKKVSDLFINLVNHLKQNSTSYDDSITKKLETYLVTLRKDDDMIENKDLLVIKKILQQFITYKMSSIFNQIINNKKTPNNNKTLSDIIESNSSLLDSIINSNNNYNLNVETINLEDKKDTSISNITKNIYLLNYILLFMIYNIYTSILDIDDDEYINIDTIITRLETFMGSTEDQDIDKKVNILSDIILHILTEFVNNIENNLIDYEKLQSNMNDLREERKQKKIKYYNNLTIDDVDVLKKLKDIGHELEMNLNEYDEEREGENIDDGINPRHQEITNDDDDRDAFEIDYAGENDDELDYDDQ